MARESGDHTTLEALWENVLKFWSNCFQNYEDEQLGRIKMAIKFMPGSLRQHMSNTVSINPDIDDDNRGDAYEPYQMCAIDWPYFPPRSERSLKFCVEEESRWEDEFGTVYARSAETGDRLWIRLRTPFLV